jgi:hypothetical protein
MTDEIEVRGIRIWITDERYPVLVLEGDCWIRGYDIDKNTGELTQQCICHARYSGECACDYNWKRRHTNELE